MALAKQRNADAYKNLEISTADQGKLIVMLYDGAVRFLKIAIDNMDPKKYDVVNNNIIKTQDIITELMLSLNMEAGGEIAANLFNLYAYLKKRLLEANMSKDSEILKEVSAHLNQLRGSWEEAAKKESGKSVTTTRPAIAEGISFSISG
jgi:flagellar protein FliS